MCHVHLEQYAHETLWTPRYFCYEDYMIFQSDVRVNNGHCPTRTEWQFGGFECWVIASLAIIITRRGYVWTWQLWEQLLRSSILQIIGNLKWQYSVTGGATESMIGIPFYNPSTLLKWTLFNLATRWIWIIEIYFKTVYALFCSEFYWLWFSD